MCPEKPPELKKDPKKTESIKVPDGVFWADFIKTLRDDPPARLEIARRYMPYPAAFKEASIALRALIRERMKQNLNIEDLLSELYLTAAQDNFLHGTPYIEELGVTGYYVAERIPKKVWKNLEMPYNEIGYEKLSLLNKTDKKWLTEFWGQPAQHQSAQDYHYEVWNEAFEKCRIKLEKQEEKSRKEWEALLKEPAKSRKKAAGCLSSLAGYILIGIFVLTLVFFFAH